MLHKQEDEDNILFRGYYGMFKSDILFFFFPNFKIFFLIFNKMIDYQRKVINNIDNLER